MALETDLDEIDWVVVDVETTGLHPDSGDRICEIGAVKYDNMRIKEIGQFQSLINPDRAMPTVATQINGIHDDMLRTAPTAGGILSDFCAFAGDSVLAAYNARFDLSFIQMELNRARLPLLALPVVDVLWMARRLLPGLRRYKLAYVAHEIGVKDHNAHRAMGDVLATGHLLKNFLPKLKAQGINTVGELMRRQGQ
jgi:DNA polymerase III epsilon subunit family exonuclease